MKKVAIFFIFIIMILTTIGVNAQDSIIYDFYYEDSYSKYVGTASNVELEWVNNALHMVTLYGPSDGGFGDPFFFLMNDEIDADTYYWAKIRIKNNSNASYFQMHFDAGFGLYAESNTLVPISKDDKEFKEYVFNIKEMNVETSHYTQTTDYPFSIDESKWTGTITSIRLDCMFEAFRGGQIETGSEFDLEYIGFFKSEADAKNFSIDRSVTPSPKPTNTPAPTPTQTPETTTKATATNTTKPNTPDKDNSSFPIVTVGVALAVIVVVCVIIIIVKKKKK